VTRRPWKSAGRWRRLAWTLLGIVLGAFGSAGASGDLFTTLQMERFTPPRRAKPFALPTLEGKTVRLADFRGKVVFLNFWATWCPACREEMPSMERLHREFKDRGLVVLAVDLEESGDAVAKFMKEFGLTFPALLDRDGRVRDSYAVRFIPTTYLVGKDGELLGRVIGPKDWASDPARRLVAWLASDESQHVTGQVFMMTEGAVALFPRMEENRFAYKDGLFGIADLSRAMQSLVPKPASQS